MSTLVLTCGTVASYDGRVPAASGEPSGSGSPSPSASVEPSWAGSRAGEGRLRPGRPEEPWPGTATTRRSAEEDGPAPPSASDPGADPHEDESVHQVADSDVTEPVLRILPLGSGLVLIGLGLGLAFVALRVRRARG
ncbi:hypothetical protein GCM10020295_40880 [Streptomyces cinereospinus]|uniref:Uncharacterized protein n=1 Tax=Streptomyces cinereospinus TaxID=285561 RepID=A0ABV5MT79_9ACTN